MKILCDSGILNRLLTHVVLTHVLLGTICPCSNASELNSASNARSVGQHRSRHKGRLIKYLNPAMSKHADEGSASSSREIQNIPAKPMHSKQKLHNSSSMAAVNTKVASANTNSVTPMMGVHKEREWISNCPSSYCSMNASINAGIPLGSVVLEATSAESEIISLAWRGQTLAFKVILLVITLLLCMVASCMYLYFRNVQYQKQKALEDKEKEDLSIQEASLSTT